MQGRSARSVASSAHRPRRSPTKGLRPTRSHTLAAGEPGAGGERLRSLRLFSPSNSTSGMSLGISRRSPQQTSQRVTQNRPGKGRIQESEAHREQGAARARRSRTTRRSAELANNTEVPIRDRHRQLSKVGPRAKRALAVLVETTGCYDGRVLESKWLRTANAP